MNAMTADLSAAARWLPRIIPAPWRVIEEAPDGFAAATPGRKFTLIVSIARYDGLPWLHASMAGPGRVPTWQEMADLKAWVVGSEGIAYQVMPPTSEYVNDHPFVLHLWAPLGHRPTPDFRHGGTI